MITIKLSYDLPISSNEYRSLRYNSIMCKKLEAITKFISNKALANQGIAQQNQLKREQDKIISDYQKDVVSYHKVHGDISKGVGRIIGLNQKKEIVFDGMTCAGKLWGNDNVEVIN